MRPDVSVVMGVYNGAGSVEGTLASVLWQTGCALEFIVVDDGSTDGTAGILDAWAAKDARLRIVHQDNTGLTRALARGCELATGEFIARQDCGDLSLPGRLEAQLQALRQEPALAFVSCATDYVDPSGALLFTNRGSGAAAQPIDAIDLGHAHGMRDGPSHHGSVMFRRDAYLHAGGYRPQFYYGQDWDLWYRLAALGRFQMLPGTLYRAQIGMGDISSTRKPQQEAIALLSQRAMRLRAAGQRDEHVLAEAATIRPRPSTKQDKKRALAAGAYFLGECLRQNGNCAKAAEYFRAALRLRPGMWKAHIRLAQATMQQLLGRRGGA